MKVETKGEPVGVTVSDAMIAVAGLAVGFALEPVRWELARVVQVCGFTAAVTAYTSAFWTLARFAMPAALGVGLVVVARRARFGGMPRAGEWLAVVTALLLLDPA